MTKNLSIALFAGIFILGFLLRYNNLYVWPRVGATFDEYAWTWQGISLIKTGIPTSWSYHPQYKTKKLIKYQTTPFILVTPYLEHPPLFGLVAGGYAILNGAKGLFDVDIYKIRGLALLMGLLSVVMVYLISSKLYGRGIGILSSLLYATVPTIVVGSRLVQNENFFIPVWLITLYLTVSYLASKKKWVRNLAAVLAGLLILAKIPWIAGAFSIVIIFLFHKRYKDTAIFLSIVICIVLLYFVYGFYYDRELFLSLWGLQLNRYDITFSSIFALFQKPYLADRYYTDGWILWGWISFFIICGKDIRKNIVLISAVLSYFLIFLAGIPDEAGHGWYRYPFYPFLMISSAVVFKEYFVKNWLLTFFFLTLVGVSLFDQTWTKVFGFSYTVFRFIIILWGISLIPQYLNNRKAGMIAKTLGYVWFFVFILMNIWAVMIYNEQ